ncbi:SWI/SNF-related, matrix-associated actin-dependent regulator of chromatin, subfamily a, containing DEAD/H box 1 isoform X2 [Arctopsyche grandis]|uniref:SWI/SNF-related, matrix-associated actin-dependent regulator of chromatin, subfamily a, containing DEAD/H box 1 isoform X2 n=1 Tax=Arctopsyche grandis TaxID=121162 RepID=UPI00406D8EDD
MSASASSSSSSQSTPMGSSDGKTAPTVYKRIRVVESESETETSPVKKVAIELDSATKERRFRNMTQMFPDISLLIVKSILLKHNWNEERARDELISFDPEQQDTNNSLKNMQNHSRILNGQAHAGNVAKVNGSQNKPKVARTKRRCSDSESNDSEHDEKDHKPKQDKLFDSDDDSDVEVSNDLFGYKKKVFEFLNIAKNAELQQLQGCSSKKAEVIISCRPFKGWIDVVEKFQDNKNLSTDLLNSAQELLVMRNNVAKLMKKCTNLASQMEAAIAIGAGVQQQPSILQPTLKLAPYQMVGLNWLAAMHKQKVNGILADEMGLGKTVQVIAFLAHLKETNQVTGTHLVIVPASTLENWNVEFARWCPSLKVTMYYGNQDERRTIRMGWARGGLKNVDVVVTTYNLVNSCPEERKMFRVTPMQYVIFDEAHMLKNMATLRYENLIRIKAAHRILLTGTPLQNNILELMSLLCFVMPHLFASNTDDLKSLFNKSNKTGAKKTINKTEVEVSPFEQTQIAQAKRIMKPFVLRRLKCDVLKELPAKTDHVLTCSMAASQQEQYKNLISSFTAKDGVIHATNEQSGISMMMDMRKLANHPLLMRNYYDEKKLHKIASRLAADTFYKEKNEQYIYEDLLFMSDFQIHQLTFQYKSIVGMKLPDELIVNSGKFSKLDELLPKFKAEGHRVLIFSQFTMVLDIIEPFLTIRGYHYLRLDGNTAVTLRQDLIDQYNEESDIFIFLLSTRAGGLGINLTAADTVIIHDIDFNPYNDKQAEDRCHRMGQKRPVSIYRLVSSGTIEEGIYQVAQEKLNLERDITNCDENEPQEIRSVVRLLNLAMGVTSPK